MIPGCILSGGKGRRIGGQGKAFINLSGKPLIYHSIENIKNQVTVLSINARNNKDYNSLDYPVILDEFNQPIDAVNIKSGDLGTQTNSNGFFSLASCCEYFSNTVNA